MILFCIFRNKTKYEKIILVYFFFSYEIKEKVKENKNGLLITYFNIFFQSYLIFLSFI